MIKHLVLLFGQSHKLRLQTCPKYENYKVNLLSNKIYIPLCVNKN